MVVMTAPWVTRRGRDPLGLEALGDKLLTIDDLGLLPDDGYRYELDEGALVVSAAPASYHNIAATRLAAYLTNACPANMVVIAGEGVMISPVHYRIPDLVVVRPDTVRSHHVDRPPLLAIEIASPSTGQYDRTRKKQVYAEFGIPDYWIITPDPEKPDITAFRLDGKRYVEDDYAAGADTFSPKRPFPVAFSPAALVSLG
jgi:Uma2 family endonuclease